MDARAVFKDLGFKEDWVAMTDQPPAYFYDFGNLLLCAVECTSSRSLKPIFLISGVKRGPRSAGQIEFEMPLTIDSFEQGGRVDYPCCWQRLQPACFYTLAIGRPKMARSSAVVTR